MVIKSNNIPTPAQTSCCFRKKNLSEKFLSASGAEASAKKSNPMKVKIKAKIKSFLSYDFV
jgi:hypothetical protein